ncbi:protein ELYS-like isoform X2 [Amphiprion ocellaris]|uniref:ELYS-like domain-containing protein n=1 Tax=Amphiprion ocellaris TaxID=80972 RepID=A0AAQ5YQB4_AMPOC|nr:protein ELYS-like isoform X2 [Amphiprion ocellaris]XP_054861978.1 protein ELYS-like isoform X2 [Amphiprion ocellaris]
MLDTESQWSEALASNNIGAIIRWLAKLTAEGDADVEEILQTFSCWVQRTSEFAKKEILTLCFSRCQGLWMFLDRSSFTRVHMLLQRLRNLLTLAQWGRRRLCSAHLWHGVRVPCMICRDTCGSSDIRRGCWNREHRALKQHIWLGRLVQWWGITGLLSKFPEAQEVKRIAQMWKEMEHSHQKACLETPGREKMGRFSSLIQGMVSELDRQHGCIWTSEDGTDQCYPPPNLQALLKLVLVPRIDNMSVQAILMYFILDVENFLQCKDDLLQSFCHAFTIPPSFSQQIRAFWMFDRGHVKASMELLLSPRAAAPWLSWQHRCIIHCLLTRKQPQVALQYLQWTRPAVETAEDAKLCADVLLQGSSVSDAWDVLKRGHSESEDMVMHFLQTCNGLSLCAEALKYIPARYKGEEDDSGVDTTRLQMMKKDRPMCPLSAKLYQAQKVKRVSSEELLTLVRKAAMEVRKPHPKISEVVWPEHTERKSNSKEIFLSTQALCHLTPSPSPVNVAAETEQTSHIDDPEEQPVIYNHQECVSSFEDLSSVSASSFTSASSLPLMKQDRPYVYKRTLTLQRISSLLTDGENQSSEDEDDEEEESRTPSSNDALPDSRELLLTPDGATDPTSISSLNKDNSVELTLSPEGGEEDEKRIEEDIFTADEPSMDENHPSGSVCGSGGS